MGKERKRKSLISQLQADLSYGCCLLSAPPIDTFIYMLHALLKLFQYLAWTDLEKAIVVDSWSLSYSIGYFEHLRGVMIRFRIMLHSSF